MYGVEPYSLAKPEDELSILGYGDQSTGGEAPLMGNPVAAAKSQSALLNKPVATKTSVPWVSSQMADRMPSPFPPPAGKIRFEDSHDPIRRV